MPHTFEEGLHDVMVNVLDCNTIVSKFKLQLSYYIHLRTNTLWKDIEAPYPLSMG